MKDKMQYYQGLVAGTIPHPPIADFMGFRVVQAEKGRIVIEMPTRKQMLNSVGAVQGGMVTTIADASMGMAAVTLLDDSHTAATIELKINFIRAPGLAKLTATGKIVHQGRKLMMAEADVVNEDGKLVAKATSTLMVLEEGKD